MKYLLLILTITCSINLVYAQKFEGSVPVWGDYTSSFDLQNQEGNLNYKHVMNRFTFEKSSNDYTVIGYSQKQEFVRIKYTYNKASKTLTLASTPTLNPHYFSTAQIDYQKKTGKQILYESDVYKAFGELIYHLFKNKYKAASNANAIDKVAFLISGDAYIGEVANNTMNGIGALITKTESHKGTWKDGEYDFLLARESAKKEWNKNILKYFDDFLFQMSNPGELREYMAEQAAQIEDVMDKNRKISLETLQTMTEPVKYKIEAHFAGINAADDQLRKMITEAEAVACEATLIHVKKMQTELNEVWKAYSKAFKNFNEQEFADNKNAYDKYVIEGEEYVGFAIEAYNRLVPLVNTFKQYPCYKTEIVKPKIAPKKLKVYSVGLSLTSNAALTELTVSSIQKHSVAEKAGIKKGDKLLSINDTYFADMRSETAHQWLQSTQSDKSYELEYFDVSAATKVTVYLKPSTYEFKVLKTEGLDNYVADANWGDKKYSGELYLQLPHGKGTVTFPNGDVYEGELESGQMTNQGIMTYADGSVYEGGWYRGEKDGKSVFTTAQGVEHHGTYKQGTKYMFFHIVYSDNNIVREYYSKGEVISTKKVTFKKAAKHIGRVLKTPKPNTPVTTPTKPAASNATAPNNKRVGVGLVIRDTGFGVFTASNTHKGWAAKKAGIYEATEILEIDGIPLKGKGKPEVEYMLKGTEGTYITVKFCPRNKPEEAKVYRLYFGKNGRAERVEN